jgi:predicted nucleotidyltransferase
MIKFGDIEYFELLGLRDKLKNFNYDRLDLVSLDKLRNEIEIKIRQIDYTENEKRKNQKTNN